MLSLSPRLGILGDGGFSPGHPRRPAGGAALFGARFYTAEETSPGRYVEGYDLSAAAIQKGGAEGVSLTGQEAHAWAEVYFDGIGWPAGCPMSSPGTIAARRPCWKRPSAAAK